MPSIVSYPDNAQVNTYELESSYHAAIMQLWLAKPSFHTPISKSGGRPITLQKWGTVGVKVSRCVKSSRKVPLQQYFWKR